MPPAPDDEASRYGLGRLLALSDGVFAIALTLLVLSLGDDLDVPGGRLGEALRDARPELLAYGLSVVVIGAIWLGHHRLFSVVEHVDNGLLWLNVMYLGLVALIPFPTDLLGRYGEETAAVVAYAVLIALVALASSALSLHAGRRGLADPAALAAGHGRTLPVAAVFLASVPVAFWSPDAAKYLWLLLIPAQRWGVRRATPSDGRTGRTSDG